MAKFEEVFPDYQELFDQFVNQVDNLREVNIKILAQNNLKELGKIVKANDLIKHMTSEDIIILLNETIFAALDDEQKLIAIEELIAQIYFDAEKDKVMIIKPDVTTFSLLLAKYGIDKYMRLRESIKAVIAQNEE
jgi:sulfur transfer complex TusBCD TusB component (DsrH family)